jgi:tyrosyl-tRNA synthetase
MAQGDGMSYAEFTYPLLQAYDWWHLYQSGVQIQIGGSDQYGNIIAGIDLIKHLTPRPSTSSTTKNLSGPFGLTVPLLTTATGAKFGKSAGNAVWLDKNMTSPFELYGFLVSSADADVQRYLKLFTFLPLTHISTVMHQHATNPSKRKAQHLLAREVVALVHGEEIAQSTQEQHFLSRNPNLQSLLKSEAVEEDDSTRGFERVYLPYSLVYMKSPARILYHAGLAKSNSDGMRMVNSGGAYIGSNNNNIINSINNQSDKTPDNKAQGQEKGEEEEEEEQGKLTFHPLKDMNAATITQTLQENKNMLILRTGKWNVKIIKVLSDEEFEQKGLAAPPGWEHVKEERN